MAGPKLPGDLTWPKLLGTCLAAVTAAWVAGHIGFTNALTGAAVGSSIATIAAAFFTTTIDRGHSVLVRTERGTVVETPDLDDVVDEATGTTLLPASNQTGHSRWSRINWQAVVVATIVTLTIALLAITLYEEAVGRTWGSNQPGTTIGNTIGGQPTPTPALTETATPTPSPNPTKSPSPTPTPTTSATPTPSPSPTPSASPSPSPSPSPSESTSPDSGTSGAVIQ